MAEFEAEKLSKIDREIRDNPERFENDIPPLHSGPAWEAYNKAMDDLAPAWVKEMKAARKKGSAEA